MIALWLGSFIGLSSCIFCCNHYLHLLVAIENLNVLVLGCGLLCSVESFRLCFVSLLVMFTVEVVLGLVILVRVWSPGGLIGFVGW